MFILLSMEPCELCGTAGLVLLRSFTLPMTSGSDLRCFTLRSDAGEDEFDWIESLIAFTELEVGVGFGIGILKNGPGTSRLLRLIVGAAGVAIEAVCGGGVHGAFLLLNSSELSV